MKQLDELFLFVCLFYCHSIWHTVIQYRPNIYIAHVITFYVLLTVHLDTIV